MEERLLILPLCSASMLANRQKVIRKFVLECFCSCVWVSTLLARALTTSSQWFSSAYLSSSMGGVFFFFVPFGTGYSFLTSSSHVGGDGMQRSGGITCGKEKGAKLRG